MDLCNWLSMNSSEGLSVEANSDSLFNNNYRHDTPIDYELNLLFDTDPLDDFDVAGVCNSDDVIVSCAESNTFEKYLDLYLPANESYSIDVDPLVSSSLPVYPTEKVKKTKGRKKSILLSSSVGIGEPQRDITRPSHRIEIAYDLEEKFRPRYKSDYFSQDGRKRKPRYVTDRNGSHFITLKVPVGVQGQIRIDWLTIPDEKNTHRSMPYRFQASNESSEVPDCNPIFENITADRLGIMKVYLVLIKAKQDALKSLQPLQPFHPLRDVFGITDEQTPEKMSKLTPKQLIHKYQLTKSQLAFTLCTLSTDGKTYIPHWDTTIFSTVLEEEVGDSPATKVVSCPNCSCSITINEDDSVPIQETMTVSKRKTIQFNSDKPKTMKKQRSLPNEIDELI